MGTFTYIGRAALQAKAIKALTQATVEAAEDLVGKAMPLTNVDTGAERAGIHADPPQVSGSGVTVKVATGAESGEYDLYQHEGTRYMSGTHFLEIPLLNHGPTYLEHIAKAAREEF
jgi:hypothetical protein